MHRCNFFARWPEREGICECRLIESVIWQGKRFHLITIRQLDELCIPIEINGAFGLARAILLKMQRLQSLTRDKSPAFPADIHLVKERSQAHSLGLTDNRIALAIMFEHIAPLSEMHGSGIHGKFHLYPLRGRRTERRGAYQHYYQESVATYHG